MLAKQADKTKVLITYYVIASLTAVKDGVHVPVCQTSAAGLQVLWLLCYTEQHVSLSTRPQVQLEEPLAGPLHHIPGHLSRICLTNRIVVKRLIIKITLFDINFYQCTMDRYFEWIFTMHWFYCCNKLKPNRYK